MSGKSKESPFSSEGGSSGASSASDSKGKAATPASTTVDLSARICAFVDREPGDVVRCTRVGERNYRCNWWQSVFVSSLDNPGMKGGQLSTTYRVRKSSFFDAREENGTLQLSERPARSPRARMIV
jgi:hypothetical protein